MISRLSLILRDVLYGALIIILFIPGSGLIINIWLKVVIIIVAVAQRVWQHVTYYKSTGKIY
jgi:hypothetical protein